MYGPEFIAERDMSSAYLAKLFKRAYLKFELDRDGDVVFHSEQGLKVVLTIQAKRKTLDFLAFINMKAGTSAAKIHALAHRINSSVIMVRFYANDRDANSIMVDYTLPYEDGIAEHQIINSIRLFSQVTFLSLKQNDKDDIVA